MPTAKSAVAIQPSTHTDDNQLRVEEPQAPPRRRGLLAVLVAAIVGASFVLPASFAFAPAVAASAGPSGCSSWNSDTRPPDYIRVLRRQSGRVERVPFRKYVVTVMGKEWPGYLPHPVVEAGAVAVKQYGWYHAMGRTHRSKRGECYDVHDGVRDQLYKPNRARIRADHHRAVDKTWNVRLLKNGRFFMTGYRRGNKAPCGRDHTGYKLYARSATRCARKGYSYLQILRRYYGPDLSIVNGRYGSHSAGQRSASFSSSSSSSEASLIDDRNNSVRLDGSWSYTSARRAIKGTLVRSSDRGATARIVFTGREMELIGRRGPGHGKIDVYVNGRRIARVDMSAARQRAKSVFFRKTWRRERQRVVKLVVVGRPTGSKVELDAIRTN